MLVDSVCFAWMGDLHLTEPGCLSERVARRFLQELESWVRPDFVQFAGDNAQEATDGQFACFQQLRQGLTVPNFSLVGDHDVHHDPEGASYLRWVGEPCGVLTLGNYRFVRLNSLNPPPLGFAEEQLDWLEQQCREARSAGQILVWLQHHYPFKVCEAYMGPGIERWRHMVETYEPLAVFCGHTHYGQVANDGRRIFVASRSIGDPEGGPPAYTLAHLQGDRLALAVRQANQAGPLVLITSPCSTLLATRGEHVVQGAGEVEVRIWSEHPVLQVAGRVDNLPWLKFCQQSNGYWSAALDTEGWMKGNYRLSVSAYADNGTVGEQSIEFRFDPTGRWAPVPRVDRDVVITEFC